MRVKCGSLTFVLVALAVLPWICAPAPCHARAALLLQQPYGVYGFLTPTGHIALYVENVCAETPVRLRRCLPGEMGAVLTRNPGVVGYDWLAIPLVPYLYAVDDLSQVPSRADHALVWKLRWQFHDSRIAPLGHKIPVGNMVRGGWGNLAGQAYDRRLYAYRFETTPEQDDALIEYLNNHPNTDRFGFFYNNCSDYIRDLLNLYFPRTFHRNRWADAGITTPKSITHQFVRFARKHPDLHLKVFEINQVPGHRGLSRANKGVVESFATTVFVVPAALISPYLAGGLLADFLLRGNYKLLPRDFDVLDANTLLAINAPSPAYPTLKRQPDVSSADPPSPPASAAPSRAPASESLGAPPR